MGGYEQGQGSTGQSFQLSVGNAMGHAWEAASGGSTTGRKQHLQTGLSTVTCPVFTGHSSPLSAHTLLPVTQRGPPRAPGTSVHPTEASGPCFHLPHPASSVEAGSNLSATLGGGWEHRCLVQGGSGSPRHGSLHSAVGLKGLRVRTACMAGPAGLLWTKARQPFPSLPDQGAARQPEAAVDRQQELASVFPSSCHKGQGPSGSGGGLSWGEDGSESLDRQPGRACRGVGLLCYWRPTCVLLKVNHVERDL